MTCNLRTVKNFTVRTNCTDRKDIAPLSNYSRKAENILNVVNGMQFTDRKTLPSGPLETLRIVRTVRTVRRHWTPLELYQ